MRRGVKLVILALVTIIVVLIGVLAIVRFGNRRGSPTSSVGGSSDSALRRSPSQGSSTFFESDGVTFEHFWPLDARAQHLKTDESEIAVHNRGSQTVTFSSVGMDYFIGGSQVAHHSGTWEKFPSDVSWEKLEYINISPQHYQGEMLALGPGQKGKIHYHYQVKQGQSQNPDQKVRLDLVFTIGSSPQRLDQELIRKEPAREATASEESHGGDSSGGAAPTPGVGGGH